MSLLPVLLDIADELADSGQRRCYGDFGIGLYPSDLLLAPYYSKPRRPQRYNLGICKRNPAASKEVSTIGKDGFQVCMDVEQFAPNEITVKTVDNTIVVEAKHEERQDEHGYVSRQFSRRYVLPEDFDAKDVISTLSSDGILTLKAPPKANPQDEGKVRHIQIQQTGPAHLTIRNKEPAESKDGTPAEVENMAE